MKVPRRPPDIRAQQKMPSLSSEKFEAIRTEGMKTEQEGKYRHWDILRHLTPPAGLTIDEWWAGIKMVRLLGCKKIPLRDRDNKDCFFYNVPDKVVELLHRMDRGEEASPGIPEPILNPRTRDQYLVRSLIQEAITSSQIEGAVTTSRVAKEMLRSGRSPRDRSEQMILNNFRTMQQIRAWKDRSLDLELIFEIHKTITDQTLDNRDAAGRLRKKDELIVIEDSSTGEVLYEPPPASELPERMKAMCDFANGKTPGHFIHPIMRAIILHFWLAYDHPFVDGNGRTARALFYWLTLKHGYWFFEFISISEIILRAPVQYEEAFLYTETDQNDLTYFIIHQSEVIQKSIKSLNNYIDRKADEIKELDILLKKNGNFNNRQESLLVHALRHPNENYTIEEHKNSHSIAYDTARKDLLELHAKGLLGMKKKGKEFIFTSQLQNSTAAKNR